MLLRDRQKRPPLTFGQPLPDVALADPASPFAGMFRDATRGLAGLAAGHQAGVAEKTAADALLAQPPKPAGSPDEIAELLRRMQAANQWFTNAGI